MFTDGFLTAKDGHTYTWGVRHYGKPRPGCLFGGRVEWVAVADENGVVGTLREGTEFANNLIVADLLYALADRFEEEGIK